MELTTPAVEVKFLDDKDINGTDQTQQSHHFTFMPNNNNNNKKQKLLACIDLIINPFW